MTISWSEASLRIRGRWAISLTAYLVAAPFWIFGFVFNENVTYVSWSNAFTIFLIATAGHVGLGLVFLIAHLSVLRNRASKPIPLGTAIGVWGLAGASRAVILIAGLAMTGLVDDIPAFQRIVFSALMAIVGFAVTAFALDGLDRFASARAEILEDLLRSEEQLSAHRAAVSSMQETLVARVDKRLRQSQDNTERALDELEESLSSGTPNLPALEELKTLSDSTWQRISQDLWNTAPTRPPKIHFREFIDVYASSRPFRLLYIALVSGFLFALVYARVFNPAVGAALVGIWLVGALALGALGNQVLPGLHKYAVPGFFAVATILVFSSIPLLVLAESWGHTTDFLWRVISVHALSVFVALSTSVPATVANAHERILSALKQSLDSATLEKLHVESQLKVLSHKIANRLHGDTRGNFLAAILKLQDHISRGDHTAAVGEIRSLRAILQETQEVTPLTDDSEGDLEKFVQNWSALVDIAFDQPLSSIDPVYLPAVHTIVVDAVNNAVRHGKANWIRISFTSESDSLIITIQNNGTPRQGSRTGLGTAQLDLYAKDQWSLVRTANGMTQLLVKLDRGSIQDVSLSR